MSNELEKKIQIVAFSTNDTIKTPNDIMSLFFNNYTHKVLRKTKAALSFEANVKNEKNEEEPTKVMMISVTNYDKEYSGINDVDCFFLIIDLEQQNYMDEVSKITLFIENNCDISKKFFVFGIFEKNEPEKEAFTARLRDMFDQRQIRANYCLLNYNYPQPIAERIMKILVYCKKHQAEELIFPDEKEETEEKKGHSCVII